MTSIRSNYLHKHLLQTPFYEDLQCAYYLPQHSVSSFQRNQCNHQRRLAANKQPRRVGLIFVLNKRRGKPRKWLETGIELINGKPHLSTVFKNRSTDRSLFPVPPQGRAATLEIAREPGTSSPWVYHVEGDSPLREVTWALEGEDKAQECWVGTYAARPSSQGGNLDVNFKHLVID